MDQVPKLFDEILMLSQPDKTLFVDDSRINKLPSDRKLECTKNKMGKNVKDGKRKDGKLKAETQLQNDVNSLHSKYLLIRNKYQLGFSAKTPFCLRNIRN